MARPAPEAGRVSILLGLALKAAGAGSFDWRCQQTRLTLPMQPPGPAARHD